MVFTLKIIGAILFGLLVYTSPVSVNAACPTSCTGSEWGCGQGGCSETSYRVCDCVDCTQNACPVSCGAQNWCYSCAQYGNCQCIQDTVACPPSCTPSCSGKNCGDDGCGGNCGTCGSGVCNSGTCCVNVAPAAPALVSPANGTQVRVGVVTTLDWTDISSWGTACTGANNRYQTCISSNQTTCDIANWTGSGLTSQRNWTPTTADVNVTWQVRSNNGNQTASSGVRSVCVEGFSASNPAYLSAWSACNATTHQRTRTCTENCGTDDCAPYSLVEDCLGEVRGTIFDASNYSACPAFDPATGFLTGLQAGEGAPSRTFGFTDQSAVPPHPWDPLSPTTTNAVGNYSISVYAPSSYVYNFDALSDIYVTSGGPKLTCNSAIATIPSNPTGCTTQPCSLVNNMSFGFWKKYGGWWQVVGGSVHAQTGIKSEIPASLPTEQSLITPDTTAGNRLGFLSYGVTRPSDIFGTNANARASSSLWEKQSLYSGPVYDWSFYNIKFKQYTRTAWDGGAFTYDDGGNGYQILETSNSVNNFSFSPTGTQNVIFLINGDVRVTSNITVPSGAFMAVIASGTITFDQAIGNADGWYIASNISIPCIDLDANGCDKTDTQFVGSGSFVAWNGMTLARDLGITNNTIPSERFSYREDLYNVAPDPMKIYTKVFKPFVP